MPFSPTPCPRNELHSSITDSLSNMSHLWISHSILLVRINCFPPLHFIDASIVEFTTLNYNNLFYGCLCLFPRLVNSNSDCIAKSWGECLLNQFSGMKPREVYFDLTRTSVAIFCIPWVGFGKLLLRLWGPLIKQCNSALYPKPSIVLVYKRHSIHVD